MTNKYLEKIAFEYVKGIHYDNGRFHVPDPEVRKQFAKENDHHHHLKALAVIPAGFAATGAVTAATAAGKQWFKNPARTAKVTAGTAAVGGALGLALAPFLAHGGNKQKSEEVKVDNTMWRHLNASRKT
jgi:hypothetical protein